MMESYQTIKRFQPPPFSRPSRERTVPRVQPPLDSSLVGAVVLPRAFPLRIPLAVGARQWAAIVLGSIGCAAVVAYVVAVHSIFLNGEALREAQQLLVVLEHDTSARERLLAERHAPLWIQNRSRQSGMVEVTSVRYVRSSGSVVFLR